MDRPSTVSNYEILSRAGVQVIKDTDPYVRRHFIDRLLKKKVYHRYTADSNTGHINGINVRTFLPEDRRYIIQQIDDIMEKNRSYRSYQTSWNSSLKEMKEDLLKLEP